MLFAIHDLLGKKKGNLLIKAEKQKKQNQFILMDVLNIDYLQDPNK
jgi:hypothetical protein